MAHSRGKRRPTAADCPDFAQLLRQGRPNRQLVEQIAACFLPAMQRLARSRCRGDPTLAEDARQEAFAAALQALPRYRGDAPLHAWLGRLVQASCARLRRGRKNDPRLHVEFDEDSTMAGDSSDRGAEWSVLWKQRLDILQRVLLEIPEPNRSLLLLREGLGLSLHELAERFQLGTGAVKTRLKRTRAQVRHKLAERSSGKPAARQR